jgi:hypothetical protein
LDRFATLIASLTAPTQTKSLLSKFALHLKDVKPLANQHLIVDAILPNAQLRNLAVSISPHSGETFASFGGLLERQTNGLESLNIWLNHPPEKPLV